ncbi:MAG: alpha-L-fucosidase [Sphaerochaeta sp.]|nr:alpha-L-fucosidase [Sphaerochaeta sp.]
MSKKVHDWQELKFGMFIHFGLYSLAGGVWKGEKITRGYSEQILSHGYLSQGDYEKLTEEFSLEKFDATSIVTLAKESGMNYLVVTTKHHDGFCLYATETTGYNTTTAACKKDIIKELSDACKDQGLAFGIYYSWIDWHFPQALPISAHNSDAIPQEHQAYNIAQLTELLTNYGPICELWMDMGAPTKEQSEEVYELVQALQPQCMINGRIWNDCGDFLTMGDNKLPTVNLDVPWQTPASIYHETWGYREWQQRGDKEEKIAELSNTARQVVEAGGNYLLNIGLMGDGSVEPFEHEVLHGIGKCLREAPLTREAGKMGLSGSANISKKATSEGKKAGTTEDVAETGSVMASKKEMQEKKEAPPLPTLLNKSPQVLPLGSPSFRYTGSEYYSYRPIPTSLTWKVEIPEENKKTGKSVDRTYEIRWVTPTPLSEELKLGFIMGDEQFYFSLQKGRDGDVVLSGVKLTSGVHAITLYTVGDALKRPELVNTDITLKFV